MSGLVAAAVSVGCGHAQEAETPLVGPAQESIEDIRALATPVTGGDSDYGPLLSAASQARFVLLGENTHGTAEYYRERSRITLQLIREYGFRAVIIEGDWPEVERVNAYVRWTGTDTTAEGALSDFARFPLWMWRNAEFAALVEELRLHNRSLAPQERVGVYGMDVYDLFGAAEAATRYLERTGSRDLAAARRHYRCFEPFDEQPEAYGAAVRNPERSCEDEATQALALLEQQPRGTDVQAEEERFAAVRHAAHVAAAEAYYRAAYSGSYSWNVRDRSMAETVESVAGHVGRGEPGRVVVWAHNTHVGDARATEMSLRGEINLGQILKERHPKSVLSVGFLTYAGRVMAAPGWGARGREFDVRPALPESISGFFRQAGLGPALILLGNAGEIPELTGRIERAIGVVYLPNEERTAHYFQASLPDQFDAVIYLPETSPVSSLRR